MSQGLQIQGAPQVGIEEALHEVRREKGVRTRCYPKWITDGKLTAFEANERYNRIRWAEEYLDRVVRGLSDKALAPILAQLGIVASDAH